MLKRQVELREFTTCLSNALVRWTGHSGNRIRQFGLPDSVRFSRILQRKEATSILSQREGCVCLPYTCSRTLKPEPIIRLGLNRYRLVLPLPSQDTDDGDSGAISDSQSEKSLARARLSSAADWVIANGEETVSTQDIERHSRAGGEYLSDKGHDTKREIASILEGINRTDIA
jgi:hypothetical protein